MIVGLNRTPLVWADEIAFSAAAYNLTLTGSSVPSHQADIETFLPPAKYYGPLYFRLAAAAIELFGLHPWSVRLVCLFGAFLATAGAYALARVAGVPRTWSLAAASIVILTPDFGSAATNGRMDIVAAGFETAALAALWRALASPPRADPPDLADLARVRWSLLAGALLGCALLATPRAFPAAFGLAIAAPRILIGQSAAARRARLLALGTAGAASAVILLGWASIAHGSPVAWAQYVLGVTAGDAINAAPLLGGRGFSGLWSPAALTPLIAVIALMAMTPRTKSNEPTRSLDSYFLTVVWVQAVAYGVLVSTPLLRSAYWAVPLTAVTFALLTRRASAHSRAAIAIVFAAGLLFAAGRGLKVIELALTWEARDHGRLEEFFRANVPAGATVTGYDQFYFYAIENAGAHFRGYAVLGQLPKSEHRDRFEDRTTGPRFFIWPELDGFPIVGAHQCAATHPVARFEPGRVRTLPLVSTFPWFTRFPEWRAYPPSVLYRVDDSCRIDKMVFSVRGATP